MSNVHSLPAGLTEIADHAFGAFANEEGGPIGANLSGLQSLPAEVTHIGIEAFCGATLSSLTSLPAGVTTIGAFAFYRATLSSLTSLPAGVTTIGAYAFRDATLSSLTSLPESLETIGEGAFKNCSLPLAELPPHLKSIGKFAFSQGLNMENATLTLPESLETIGDGAFSNCNMGGIKLPSHPVSAGIGVFQLCYGFTKVTIPGGSTVWPGMFYGCQNLKTVTIPDNVTDIGKQAFQNCLLLETVHLSNSLTAIGKQAFSDCPKLETITIPDNVTTIGNGAFQNSGLTGITIPDNVTVIGDSAFQGCTSLASADLSNSLTNIGNSTFQGCDKLAGITIPDNVTAIGNSAFQGCDKLAGITIPDSVTAIGDSAFQGCTSLASADLSNSLTDIGNSAFQGCDKLAGITIPDSVTAIGDSAFQGCAGLTTIAIPAGVERLGKEAFAASPGQPPMQLKNIYLQGANPPTLQDSDGNTLTLGDVFPSREENPNLVIFVPENAPAYADPNWKALGDRRVSYSDEKMLKIAQVNGLKPSKNGNPPVYAVWDTVRFQVPDSAVNPPEQQIGDFRLASPTGWHLNAPVLGDATAAAARTTGDAVAPTGLFPPGGPYTGAIYPSRDRPYGVYTLQIDGQLQIYVGPNHEGGEWREFPLFEGAFNHPMEFLPPPIPAEASYLLTVENGTGSGYYEAEDSAPIVAQLKAEPPVPGAKFLRWDLVSGTGTFADANSPETRFTMAVGDSAVRAVFDTTPAAKPLIQPTATPQSRHG